MVTVIILSAILIYILSIAIAKAREKKRGLQRKVTIDIVEDLRITDRVHSYFDSNVYSDGSVKHPGNHDFHNTGSYDIDLHNSSDSSDAGAHHH